VPEVSIAACSQDTDADGDTDFTEGELADGDGDGVPDYLESALADADLDGTFDQFDPADADACLPDPGACLPVAAVPSGGPMLRVLLALALGLVMIGVGPRKETGAV
jgi:hypothetical protein